MASRRGTKAQANMFIASTKALFAEAKSHGFTSVEDIRCLNSRIIKYVISTRKTNKSSPKYIRFPDGQIPKTLVAIPPEQLRINKTNQKRLEVTDSDIEFVGILRSIITGKPSGWKDDWNNGRRRRARMSTQSSSLSSTDGDQPEDIKPGTPELEIESGVTESVADENDPASDLGVLPDAEDCQPAVMTPKSDEIPNEVPNDQCDACSVDSEVVTDRETTREPSPQEPDCLDNNQQLNSLEPHASEVNSGHEDCPLDSQEEKEGEDGDEDEEEKDSALKRMKATLPPLKEEIAKIPSQNWEGYEAELTSLFTSSNIDTMGFSERLHKIRAIIYLPEELEVIANQQWDRLGAAISICAVIAEATGPRDEAIEASLTNKWVKSRIRDIAWLEKILACNN